MTIQNSKCKEFFLKCLFLILQDGEIVGGDKPDPEMTDVKLPDSFLSDFYLGRCNYDEEYSCSSPESKFTDLNIWDRLLSTQDLLDWTTCRYVKHMLGRFSICRSSLRSLL